MAVSQTLKRTTLQPFSPLAINAHAPGLTFNPSRWGSRCPILILAVAGFCIASYLALYQWGIFQTVWEPFFGNGSERVLHSFISRLLPVPDAFLGMLGYLADILTGSLGGRTRWWTAPWIVLAYGATVTVVGAVALVLVALQPLLLHAACTLCLVSAFVSITVAWLARHEVLASFHYVRSIRGQHPNP